MFISDLDNTLIYSNPQNGICVEWKDGREMSYMTKEAYDLLCSMLNRECFQFIPCTARSKELTMRIEFIKKYQPRYMICDHGGSIYINGIREKAWDKYLEKFLSKSNLSKMIKTTKSILNENNITYRKISSNVDLYFVISFHQKETAGQANEIIKKQFDPIGYRLVCQGRKIYCLPLGLDKSIALKYLIDTYRIKDFITAGDSIFDESFTALGDSILLPSHASFHHMNACRMEKDGIYSGEELIEKLYQLEFGRKLK